MSSTKKKIIVGVLVIVLAAVAYLAYYVSRAADYQDSLSNQPAVINPDPAATSTNYRDDFGSANVVYLAFLGIDRDSERDEWLGIYRTDSISVVRLDLDKKTIRVLGIPRDTYTYIPVEGKMDKINHAYAYGSMQGRGVEECVRAINSLLGKDVINHYFLIDMDPIPAIVDEIGGVKVDVLTDLKDIGLYKGVQVLNGQQALAFVRDRNTPGGDIDRIKRQQQFFSSLLTQQRASGRIIESMEILLKYHDGFRTSLSVEQFIGLGRFLMDVPDNGVEYSYIVGESKMINGVSYVVPYKTWNQEQVIKPFFRE